MGSEVVKRKKKTPAELRADKNADILFRAVASYVKKEGGRLVVVGPIHTMQWPEDTPNKWSLVIGCLGRKPATRSREDGAR